MSTHVHTVVSISSRVLTLTIQYTVLLTGCIERRLKIHTFAGTTLLCIDALRVETIDHLALAQLQND